MLCLPYAHPQSVDDRPSPAVPPSASQRCVRLTLAPEDTAASPGLLTQGHAGPGPTANSDAYAKTPQRLPTLRF